MQYWVVFAAFFALSCSSDNEPRPEPDSGTTDTTIDVTIDTGVTDALLDMPVTPKRFDTPYEVACLEPNDGFVRFTFDIEPTTVRFQLVPFNTDDSPLLISEIEQPDGGLFNFGSTNEFQVRDVRPNMPIVVPGTPSLQAQLQAGTYSVRATTSAPEFCYYVAQFDEPGDRFDVNLYFASANYTAATAPSHVEFQVALSEFTRIYGAAGITVDKVRYFDIESTDYRILEQVEECHALFSESISPGADPDDARSLNIFVIDDLTWSTILGTVHGVCGPTALHGTRSSGVLVTDKYLGQTLPLQIGGTINGSVLMGITMAHETAHYFGLRHTSERSQVVFDPLNDTPECTSGDFFDCPDVDNLLFFGGVGTELTPQQAAMIRLHPLIK